MNPLNQGHLGEVVKQLFPGYKIIGNARKAANVVAPTGQFLEIDFWLPELRLGFEFQDPHHYTASGYSLTELQHTVKKDVMKKNIVDDKGDTLVVVPCWWDSSIESLQATINTKRPELFPDLDPDVKPIPNEPPVDFFKKRPIPGVGELMIASFAPENRINTKGWWISEKYDGIRFFWNPNTSSLYSRTGAEVAVDSNYEDSFPDIFIDGELWCGRDSYKELQRIYAATSKREESASSVSATAFLRFVSFDDPNEESRESAFETRVETLLQYISPQHPSLIVTTNCRIPYRLFLNDFFSNVIGTGGEGIIVRKPETPYIRGITYSLLKFKAERDQEGLIVAMNEDSYTLKLPDDTLLEVDMTNQEQEEIDDVDEGEETDEPLYTASSQDYRVGEIVTFVFSHWDKLGSPLRARLQRKRTDVTWDDVVAHFRLGLPVKKSLGEVTQRALGAEELFRKPPGHWTVDGSKNIRKFFDDLAHSLNKDPLDPETWYTFSSDDLQKAKGAYLARHYTSISNMFISVYPNIGLDPLRFPRMSHNFWNVDDNKKAFFDGFAKRNGFDPLVAENWYTISRAKVEREKGAYLLQHGGFLARTLQSVYPNIGIDPSKFTLSKPWQGLEIEHRNFFIRFAKRKGFDPLVPTYWYSIAKNEFLDMRGANTILCAYNKSLKTALFACFPDIGLDESKFNIPKPQFWGAQNRREFFDTFAKLKKFDPLIASNWYKVSAADVSLHQGRELLQHSRNSLCKALMDAYPDIGLNAATFYTATKKHWSEQSNRRRFLECFAESKGFDPLDPVNWYRIGVDDILKEKGGHKFLGSFENSVVAAITTTYPDIGLNEFQFNNARNFWSKQENVQRFFNEFAKRNDFDPMVPANWYSCTPDKIREELKGASVLGSFAGSFVRALRFAYPSSDFDESAFTPSKVWVDDPKNRRQFLDEYAHHNNFDPLDSDNWKTVSIKAMRHGKGQKVLKYYNGSLVKALMDVYSFAKI